VPQQLKVRIEELRSTGRLPSPTGVAVEILRITSREDASPDELAKVLQADPAMTARLLKYANSAHSGSRKAITTVRAAVLRLGFATVRQLALGFSLLSRYRQGPCKVFNYDAFWSRSLARAVAAKALCDHKGVAQPDEGFTCGLLGTIGVLALTTVHPDAYGQLLLRYRRKPTLNLRELEQEQFAIDHRELTACLLGDWGIPEELVTAVYYSSDPTESDLDPESLSYQMARILQLGELCAALCVADGVHRQRMAPSLLALGEQLGFEIESLAGLYDKILQDWKEWGSLLDVKTKEQCGLMELLAQSESEENAQERDPKTPAVEEPEQCATEQDGRAPQEPEDTREEQIRVLLVDDNPLDRRLLERVLTESGYVVSTAENGDEALAKALQEKPDIIVTDWMMPGMDGLAFCRALRQAEATREIYLLMLTACEDEEHLVEAFEAGADDYVVKPFKLRIFKARMHAARRIVELQRKVARDREQIERYAAELGIANRKLEQAALTDPLTGLPNRRYALEALGQMWAAAQRHGRVFSCMIIDIDHFKKVNDNYGHDVGDAVLRETAAVLRRLVRRDDVVCRFGGEEFLLLCNETGRSGAEHLGRRLCRGVAANEIHTEGFTGSVKVSVGVASFSSKYSSPEELLKAADEALYTAKRTGRNRVCVAP